MSGVISAIVVLLIIGAVAALILVIASKYMSVPENEMFPAIRECLPGANCGACGYTGCDGYAKALAEGEETKTNLCVPGADGAAAAIAEIMGVEAEDVVEMVAYVKCNGNCETAKHKYEYAGINNCSAANILFQGEWACPNSCLGYGDCENACPSDAIHVVNGVAKVYPGNCTGCGICVSACPAKNKANPERKAINMDHIENHLEEQVACWNFFETLPYVKRTEVVKNLHRLHEVREGLPDRSHQGG